MWLAKVMVPLVRSLVRMDRYWLKVAVPWMEGASLRTTSYISGPQPSARLYWIVVTWNCKYVQVTYHT